MSAEPEVLLERRGRALWITINRPQRRNALNDAVLRRIADGYHQAAQSRDVRAIVLTGAGDRAFCAGADLEPGQNFAFNHDDPSKPYADLARIAQASPLPSIARVNGACVAGGMGLLGMVDMAVSASTAVFALPEARVGLFPLQVCALLKDMVPRRLLREWSLCGERFGPAEALRAGLINAVVAPEELDAATERYVAQICAGSPVALRRGLWTLRQLDDQSFGHALAFAEAQIGLAALTADAREGIQAFNEKRPPGWTVG
jgi:enoyl-CoA hydratase/carnithine racemase